MNRKDREFLKETYQQVLKEVESKKDVDKEHAQILRRRIRELEK